MTREKADLDVWQQEELIMDQLKENCRLLNDPKLFEKLYQKEIHRRAHSFFMRKEVKVGGKGLEEIRSIVKRLRRRTKDKGGDKS